MPEVSKKVIGTLFESVRYNYSLYEQAAEMSMKMVKGLMLDLEATCIGQYFRVYNYSENKCLASAKLLGVNLDGSLLYEDFQFINTTLDTNCYVIFPSGKKILEYDINKMPEYVLRSDQQDVVKVNMVLSVHEFRDMIKALDFVIEQYRNNANLIPSYRDEFLTEELTLKRLIKKLEQSSKVDFYKDIKKANLVGTVLEVI